MRRLATSNRSVVTAAKLVYSAWKFQRPGERHGKTLYRDRSASQSFHLLHSLGERADLRDGMGVGGSGEIRQEAAAERRSGGGNHVQHAVVSRCCGWARGTCSGGGYQPVPG